MGTIPKYVKRYFNKRVTKNKILKRYNNLDKTKFGYKTKEYRDLKRYLKK